MIGTLGDIVFETSMEKVLTFSGFVREGEPRYEEHAVIGRKPVIEYLGPALDKATLSIRLDVGHGVNPKIEIKKLRDAMGVGEVLPLTIGGEFFGDWMISQLSEDNRTIDNRGNILVAELALSLVEVAL